MAILNRCIFNVVGSGLNDFVVSGAVAGYQTPAAAGAVNGRTYSYVAQSADLTQWEYGTGVYTVATTTLARTSVQGNNLNTSAKINFSSSPQVMMTALASDFDLTQIGGLINTSVLFDNSGAFGGDSSFTYAGSGQATLALGTITANAKALNITGTWNAGGVTFDAPLFMNIGNTASAAGSLLMDLQVSGTSVFTFSAASVLSITSSGGTNKISTDSGGNFLFALGASAPANFQGSSLPRIGVLITGDSFARVQFGVDASNAPYFGLGPGNATRDTFLRRISSGIFGQSNTSSAQGLQVYNTTDSDTSPVNYERGVFDFTTTPNVLTIGTQKGGGTTFTRNLQFVIGGTVQGDFGVSTANNWTFNQIVATSGVNVPGHISFGYFQQDRIDFALGTAFLSWGSNLTISFIAPLVIGFGNAQGDTSGWINWGGEKRVTSDFSVTSSTTLTNITGLSVSLAAGRTYTFETELYITDAAAGGVQAAIAGTATATAIQYTGYTIADNAIKAKTNATALATAVASTLTTETSGIIVRVTGTITVNAAGTLTVQMAQNTSSATATVAKRGSYFIVHDMP